MTTLDDNKKGGAMRFALTGASYDAVRTVEVDVLTTNQGHIEVLKLFRLVFAGSDSKRGHSAYRKIKKTYRSTSSMETYLSAMTLVLAECKKNGYEISGKAAVAIILEQGGLDTNQQEATISTAAMHAVPGLEDVAAMKTAMSGLWGGDTTLAPSASAAMMCVIYGEHAAYMAVRRTNPAAPGAAGGPTSTTPPKLTPLADGTAARPATSAQRQGQTMSRRARWGPPSDAASPAA